jgi:hypothetical protein
MKTTMGIEWRSAERPPAARIWHSAMRAWQSSVQVWQSSARTWHPSASGPQNCRTERKIGLLSGAP